MTESEWLAIADPEPLLKYLAHRSLGRRCRLFALACFHRCRRFITDPRSVAALELADRYAERGLARLKGRRDVEEAASQVYPAQNAERDRVRGTDPVRFAEVLVAIGGSLAAQRLVALGNEGSTAAAVSESLASSTAFEWALRDDRGGPPEWDPAAMGPEKAAQANLARDIFGNPFRTVSIDPCWLEPTVSSLAQTAYEARIMPSGELDLERLAVLSDALEEAGCDDADILSHLRSPGPHVRGCWAVDLLTGRN